jgi:hypothetical protein
MNLNGGNREGSLNPMQLSILVRLITKRHDLMQVGSERKKYTGAT